MALDKCGHGSRIFMKPKNGKLPSLSHYMEKFENKGSYIVR